MSNSMKSILFAIVLCVVCSILLTTATSGLQKYQQRNILLDKQINILKSIGLVKPNQNYPVEAISKMYADYIKPLWVDPEGAIVPPADRHESDFPIYLYVNNDEIEGYVIPISTRGLWGKINGYLALQNDGSTISGFTVYQHSETPGLGGEIEKSWFQKNWVGKKIVDGGGEFVSVNIAKGNTKDNVPVEKQINYVDGISGATLTGKYLTSGLKEILSQYEPVSIKFRKNMIQKEVIAE